MNRFFIITFFVLFIFENISYSETEIQRKVFSPSFSSLVEYRSWEKSSKDSSIKISQFSSPSIIKVPISRNLAVDFTGSFVLSKAENNELSGLSDIKTRAVIMLFNDSVMLSAGAGIPNGKSNMDMEEVAASELLSEKIMGFRYNKLGEGLDFNIAGGFAQAFGPLTFGAGAGYLIKGEYKYIEDRDMKYKPGDQANITSGFDLLLEPILLRSDVTYTTYQIDKNDGLDFFKEGSKLSIAESILIKMDRLSIVFSGKYIKRGKSKILYLEPDIEKKTLGNEFDLIGTMSYKLINAMILNLLTESVTISDSDIKGDRASILGLGGGFNIKFTKRSFLDISGKYYIGNSNRDDSDLKGFSVAIYLRLVF
ncbi:MAG: hypothetical protein ACUVWN_12695 [bacterium]